MPIQPATFRAWLSICLLVSGAAALVYELAWLRLLALAVGNTAYATSCILSIFLGGLALGAYFGGKFADKKSELGLKAYGVLEICIGLSAPITSFFLSKTPEAVAAICTAMPGSTFMATALTILLSCLLLLPATMLMGATLPVVMRFVQTTGEHSKWFSWLYGVNTLGAVLGSFSAALLGFAYVGIFLTTAVAGLCNFAIGIANICIANRSGRGARATGEDFSGNSGDSPNSRIYPSKEFLWLSSLAFLCGYTAVSYEVLWTRLLRFFTGSLTYAFSVMLGTFLLGLAAGSILYERRILKNDTTTSQRYYRFANLQYLASISCAGSLIATPIALLIHLPISAFPLTNPWPMMANIAAISFVLIFVPAMLIGTLFPLLGTIATDRSKDVASSVGITYAANTIGCVLGSLVTGLVLMPLLGSYHTFQLTVLISAITATIALFAAGANKKILLAAGALPLTIAAAFMAFVYVPYMHFISIQGGSVLKAAEDAIGSMLIIDYPPDTRVLLFNGSSLATTAPPSLRYMRLLGHLPVLVHENPQKVLVACFGTGSTCGAACSHPMIKSVDIVELSSMVFHSGDFFAKANQNVLHNPKLQPTITDARNFLLLTNKLFDIITFEPPPPCDASIVNLYTADFYRIAKARLRPNGILCQWVPTHDASEQLWKMQVKSACAVFPYVSVWLSNSGEAILLCSDHEPKYDIDAINKRMHADAKVEESLHEVGFDSAADILATFISDGESLNSYINNCPTITDDKPSLEFFHPYAGKLIGDLDLLKLPGFTNKDFSHDATVQKSREALLLSMCKADNPSATRNLLQQAIDVEPNNKWFAWLLLHSEK
jgi:predicted membrane-bound spermidine synthase